MITYKVYANGTYWGQWAADTAEEAMQKAVDEVGTVDVGEDRASTEGLTAVGLPPDFALYHVADWRDGEMPKTDGATHVVSHDTRHHAYNIPAGLEDDLAEWAAGIFGGDNDRIFACDYAGTIWDYLDEIGVNIRAI